MRLEYAILGLKNGDIKWIWQHFCSKVCHGIDYIVTRQIDHHCCQDVQVVQSAAHGSDH